MRVFGVATWVLLAAVSLQGQSGSQSSDGAVRVPTTQQVPLARFLDMNHRACPVGFYSERSQGLTALRYTGQSRNGTWDTAFPLRITLDRKHAVGVPEIESVLIRVNGVLPKPMVFHADGSGAQRIKRTLELRREDGQASLDEASVMMKEMASVGRVDLVSVTYTNGTSWHETSEHRCEAPVSGFLRVDGTAR